MRIIRVSASFAPKHIKQALKILTRARDQALALQGCLEYENYVQAEDANTVFIFQAWQNESAFEAYRASAFFAQMGVDLKPVMTSPPQTDIFEAEKMT